MLPGYQGQGIGTRLMELVLDGCERFYSVDLICDEPLQSYYARLGMAAVTGAGLRQPAAMHGNPGTLA